MRSFAQWCSDEGHGRSRFPSGYIEDLKPVETPIASSPGVVAGSFRCPVKDTTFKGSEELHCHFVVFPRTSIDIAVSGHRRFVSTPANATFHAPGSSYTRRVVDPRGDLSDYVALSDELLRSVALQADPGEKFCSWSSDRVRFRFPVCPMPPDVFLAQRRFFMRAARKGFADELLLEESALKIVAAILAVGAGAPMRADSATPSSRQAEAVERACAFMAADPTRHCRLGDIAAAAFVSPYHLARLFHQSTGFTLHGFLTTLRLREAAGMLDETVQTLKRIARETGFSSHPHLTRSFQRHFGILPSEYRASA